MHRRYSNKFELSVFLEGKGNRRVEIKWPGIKLSEMCQRKRQPVENNWSTNPIFTAPQFHEFVLLPENDLLILKVCTNYIF